MAIVIPSKNIYDKNNPKVRDNVVDNVSVSQTVVLPDNQYDIPVYNETFRNFSITDIQGVNENFAFVNKNTRPGSTENVVVKFVSYIAFDNCGKTQVSVKIPIVNNNSYIQSILHGTNEQGNTNIKYTLHGYKNSGTVSGRMHYDYADNLFSMSNITPTQETSELQTFQIPKQETFFYEGYYPLFDLSASVSSTVSFANLGTILTATPKIVGDNYEISFDFISKYRVVKIGHYFAAVGSSNYTVNGTYEEYIPQQIEITFYGNTIGIDLKDGTVKIGDGNKPYSLDGNELLQDSGKVNEKSITQHLGENVINQYQKGKETATLLCDISDYYAYGQPKSINTKCKSLVSIDVTDKVYCYYTTTNNDYSTIIATTSEIFEAPIVVDVAYRTSGITKNATVIIPAKSSTGRKVVEYTTSVGDHKATLYANMVFEENDQVIPMVLGADGQDRPMSSDSNGNPKVFTVVGTNIIYDGAVWQEITLQEYNN